jgi:hypothetical protein
MDMMRMFAKEVNLIEVYRAFEEVHKKADK